MPLAIVTPRKAPSGVLAILILAHIPIVRFGSAVTTRHMAVLILLPVESLGRATGEVTLERTAVGFEVFTARPLALSRGKRGLQTTEILLELASSLKSLQEAFRTS